MNELEPGAVPEEGDIPAAEGERKYNPVLEGRIMRRRHLSEAGLTRHGAERLESGELVLTEQQIARIKKKGERFPDEQLFELYELVDLDQSILTRLEPSGPFSEEESAQYQRLIDEGKRLGKERRKSKDKAVRKELLDQIKSAREQRSEIAKATADRQKQSFLNGEIENPQFFYPVLEFGEIDLDQTSQNLRDAKKVVRQSGGDPILKALYSEKINQSIASVEMLRAVKAGDDHKFYRYSKFIYGEPDEEIYRIALSEVEGYQPTSQEPEPKLSDEVIKACFKAALAEYGWKKPEIKISARTRRVTTSPKSISLPKGLGLTPSEIKTLMAHELETHALRRRSGKKAGLRLLRSDQLARYLPTEEGLATYAEQRVQESMGISEKDPEFAIRLIGLHLAKTHNFRGTYEELFKLYRSVLEKNKTEDPEKVAASQAYELCIRIFRGTHHPENAGHPYTKDWVYFKGNLDVATFISEGGDISRLYIGKIGIQHLQVLTELGINTPAIQPRFVAQRIEPLGYVRPSDTEETTGEQ